MSEVIETAAAAPAVSAPAAPAVATSSSTPTAETPPATATAGAPESLIHGEAPAAKAAEPGATTDPFAEILGKVPEKFHVRHDGKLDTAASVAKALEHREHLEKRLGAGDIPPKTAAEYGFQLPADMAGFELKSDRMEQFKVKAHELGFTQQQFEFAMSSYLSAVPDLMEGAAKLTATQAREELGKVWQTPADLESNIGHAQRAIKALPSEVFEATRELGTNPVFLRAMAHLGRQMAEDKGPATTGGGGASQSVDDLMKHPAYIDPKHPQHQQISQQVAQAFKSMHGTAAI